jgi:superfamily I DNA/RNA helicase
MAVRTIIPGPPGTGKTYRLVNHYLAKEINDFHTDPKKIVYVTFSNAAAKEACKRIKHPLLYISTLHHLGTRECNIDTTTQLLKDRKWKQFTSQSQICRGMKFETKRDTYGNTIHQNSHMRIITYSRSKKIDLVDAAVDLDLTNVELFLTEQIDADLKSYKDQTGMVEFSDMITKFVEEDKRLALDAIFLDEAQDLSPLQWDMFFHIEKQCKRSYIAGDDDQTIYGFQGADPSIFINLKSNTGESFVFDNQIKSRRVPRKVHAKATEILKQIDKRLDKPWEARDEEGSYKENCLLSDFNFRKDEWMILAQTNAQLREPAQFLNDLNLRYKGGQNELLPSDLLDAYRTWTRLNDGATVSGEEAQHVIKNFLRKKQVKRGFGEGKLLDKVFTITLEELQKDHGLLVTGSWEHLHMSDDQKNYIKLLLKNGDDLTTDSKVELSTIHGAKGRECENVILYIDFGSEDENDFLAREADKDPDKIHRLFFVGVTRAKQNLYIMESTQTNFYNIGYPIV